ncbi:MAG: carbohydrate binding family 9 domain-containing protein [Acidobacteriia bacterium]|nr:carbohydrate binding family 9 domain-containing protein [Terriglobia bacterium]
MATSSGWCAPAPQAAVATQATASSSAQESQPSSQSANGQQPAAAPQNPPAQLSEPPVKNPQGQAAPKPAVEPPTLTIPLLASAPTLENFLTMKPLGDAARQMAKVTGFVQRNPHDGESVSEPTEAYLGYDKKNLYVVFVCFDDPGKVRGRMSRREDIFDDDQVEVMLDTFHDRRRAYAFQSTPLGVQWDAIYTEASREEVSGNFDTSFDTVWDSRGKETSQGFVVWMSIPFKSLRFPAVRQQEWGIILYRGIIRNNEDTFWPHVSYKVQGRLGQAATLSGLEGISPGRSIELIPYGVMRGFRALDTRDPSNPFFQHAVAQGQPGMDAKFVIRDHFVVDMTANPDFSQVESEDPQITVNQRFAVYFPEKRPFFLENEDYFRTPLNLFFTRNIGDPSAGIRLTGKQGPYSVGLMTTDDRSPGLLVPDADPRSGTRSYFTIARASRDIFKQSSVGVIYTDWEYPASKEFNRIGGIDTRLKFNANWTLEGQAIVSSTDCRGVWIFCSSSDASRNYEAGPADKLDLKRDGLHFTYEAIYDDISPGFTTVPGFVNRTDIRYAWQEADYRFRPKKGWIVDWGPTLINRYVFDHTGLRLDTDYRPYFAIQGRGQTYIFLFPYEELRERLRPKDFFFLTQNQDFHEHTSGASIQTGYFPKMTVGASYYWGDGVNFVPAAGSPFSGAPFLARSDTGTAMLTLRPVKPLKIENTYLFERLRATDSTYLAAVALTPGIGKGILNDHIVRSKWNWQFTPKLSLRVILQYNALLANTPGNAVYPYTFLPTSKQFNADFLITYLVHPGTAVYVGYNSDVQNLDHGLMPDPAGLAGLNTAKGFINDSRQFFVKVSYQFRF